MGLFLYFQAMRLLSIILFFSTLFSANAQRFFVVDSLVELEKSTEFGVVHWYGQLTNNTSDDLGLEWEFVNSSSFPAAWVINWDIGGEYYTDIQRGDQEAFVLPANVVKQKVIIGIDHQDEQGSGELRFCFREVGSTQCEYLVFKVEITGGKPDGIPELKSSWRLTDNGISPRLLNASGLSFVLLDKLGKVYASGVVESSVFSLPQPVNMQSAILRVGAADNNSIPVLWTD